MDFINRYKSLEQICNDLYGGMSERKYGGVSAYIEDMQSKPGAYYVEGWNADLLRLKELRRIRNQIVHDPNASEETLTTAADVEYLETFRQRILHGTDPLALYEKERRRRLENAQPHRTPNSVNPVQPARETAPERIEKPTSRISDRNLPIPESPKDTEGEAAAKIIVGLLFVGALILIAASLAVLARG